MAKKAPITVMHSVSTDCRHPTVGVITFAPDSWTERWMVRHHVMARLTNYFRVLWMVPPGRGSLPDARSQAISPWRSRVTVRWPVPRRALVMADPIAPEPPVTTAIPPCRGSTAVVMA